MQTYDAKMGMYFSMKVMLLMMVQEYPAYNYNLGKVCRGNCTCVRCMDETHSLYLKTSQTSHKTIYTGHRRWLDKNDEWRNREDLFNNRKEKRGKPRKRSGIEILQMLNN